MDPTHTISRGIQIGQTASEPPMQPFTDFAAAQIEHLRQSLADARIDLAMLHDRMFGNPNQTSAGPAGTAPQVPLPTARTDAVMSLIGSCQFEANEISALARGLNGRL